MLSYRVTDLDRFFLVYDLTLDEEAEVAKRFETGDKLYVFQDGAARWMDGDEVVAPDRDEEVCQAESFQLEAKRCGSVATAVVEEED